jgi:glutathione S-transferase
VTFVLYGDRGSGAFSVEAALAEAHVAYEFRTISLKANQQREPDFLAINPSGKMPALKLPEGGIVTESLAILVTIAERFPDARLLPRQESAARGQALRWLAFMATELYPMVEIVDYPARFVPEGAESDALRERAREKLRERFLIVEQAVAGPWLLAEGFSVADIYVAMFSRWDIGAEYREQNLPKVSALANAVAQRPCIAPIWQRHFPPTSSASATQASP